LSVEYRPIPGFPAYRAGSDGSVWSCWKRIGAGRGSGQGAILHIIGTEWRRLRTEAKYPYPVVRLVADKPVKMLASRLVLLAFVGPPPPGHECCHFPDRDPRNCRLENLRWGTRSENRTDGLIHGTRVAGERHPAAKLSLQQVRAIRQMHGVSQYVIAAQFGVSQGHVSDILSRKTRSLYEEAEEGIQHG